jgi:Flp pilus assembly protein TadD
MPRGNRASGRRSRAKTRLARVCHLVAECRFSLVELNMAGAPTSPKSRSGRNDGKRDVGSTSVRRVPDDWLPAFYKALIILLATMWAYAPAYHGDWLWDDDQLLTANADVQQPGGLSRIWFKPTGADYFPLSLTSLWIEWRLWGMNPTGYHVTNVILHALGSIMVWRLLARMGIGCAWFGALLYALHPMNVESVAWISERKNALSLPLFVLAAWGWSRFDQEGKNRHYLVALVGFLLAMLAKTSVVMLPIVFLMHAWWKRGRIALQDVKRAAPFFLISLILGLITLKFQHERAIGGEVIPIGGALSRIATAGLSLWFYLWKAILPFELLPIYPRWNTNPPNVWQVVLPWTGVLVVAAACWFKRNSIGKHLLFGLGYFAVMLLPILGFITISYMRISWVADHFVHLPLISIVALAAAAAAWAYDRLRANKWLQSAGVAVASALVIMFAIISFTLAGHYQNEEALWHYTLSKNYDAWQAHNRLGAREAMRGNMESAHKHFTEAVRLRPDLGETQHNLGMSYLNRGDVKKAYEHYRMSEKNSMESDGIMENIAAAYARMGRFDDATRAFQHLLKRQPQNPAYLCNYGVVLYHQGKLDEAIDMFRKSLQIDPRQKDARDNLNAALRMKGETVPGGVGR